MIQVYPRPEELADAVADHVSACAREAISTTGRFTLALSGGSTPQAAYSRLGTRDSRLSPDEWQRFHIVWGDERCVPPDDPRSNYRMAKEALLDRVPIPPQNVHRIRGEDDPEHAAADYENELEGLLREQSPHPERSEGSSRLSAGDSEDPSLALRMRDGALRMAEGALGMTKGALRMTRIDLVLLGLGEDGHTASLFPGQPAVHETTRWVVAVPGPSRSPLTAHLSPEVWRVTLTPVILNAARNICFVVSGGNKAARLQQVIEGPFTPDLLPAQAIRPDQGRVTWMIDAAAGARLRSAPVAT